MKKLLEKVFDTRESIWKHKYIIFYIHSNISWHWLCPYTIYIFNVMIVVKIKVFFWNLKEPFIVDVYFFGFISVFIKIFVVFIGFRVWPILNLMGSVVKIPYFIFRLYNTGHVIYCVNLFSISMNMLRDYCLLFFFFVRRRQSIFVSKYKAHYFLGTAYDITTAESMACRKL